MKTSYRSNTYLPELVEKSKALAMENDFMDSCTDEAGRMLSVLAAQIKQGKILEIGTGFGVGSSWILSSLSSTVEFFSVDHAPEKIKLTAKTINHPQANFVNGDWTEMIAKGPFQFVFADAAVVKTAEGQRLIKTLEIGGLLFMDDFTPEEHWPEEWKGKPDTTREFWLNHADLASTEIYLTPKSSAIICTKIR